MQQLVTPSHFHFLLGPGSANGAPSSRIWLLKLIMFHSISHISHISLFPAGATSQTAPAGAGNAASAAPHRAASSAWRGSDSSTGGVTRSHVMSTSFTLGTIFHLLSFMTGCSFWGSWMELGNRKKDEDLRRFFLGDSFLSATMGASLNPILMMFVARTPAEKGWFLLHPQCNLFAEGLHGMQQGVWR